MVQIWYRWMVVMMSLLKDFFFVVFFGFFVLYVTLHDDALQTSPFPLAHLYSHRLAHPIYSSITNIQHQ